MTASQNTTSPELCPRCSTPIAAALRHCSTCGTDLGAPNVRDCLTPENLRALDSRFDAAITSAIEGDSFEEFSALQDVLLSNSGVVVSMDARMARGLFDEPQKIYTSYENLVGARARTPAIPEYDRQRYAVGGVLFGNYASSIIYGALSLTNQGLSTYGNVQCRLKPVAIETRTSFLEKNSYEFIRQHSVIAGDERPLGFFSCWENRYKLVLTKVVNDLSNGQSFAEWQEIILRCDGEERTNDDFVEAHIYEGFDMHAIESVEKSDNVNLDRSDQLDFDIVVDMFTQLNGAV